MASKDNFQRSLFVTKLHELLSAEQHPDWLKWLSNDTFGITSIESQAKAALAPQWEFRSLSSFIRQLSYYSFKRLSDRRRSAERRAHCPSLIVFTHTSGNFVRDDISKTANIPRKLRARKSTAGSRRKSSTASSIAFDYEYQDRSPTPEPYYPPHFEDETPTQTHISLASYQLQPWSVSHDAQSSPRSLPISPPTNITIPSASLRHSTTQYDSLPCDSPLSRSYPSPISSAPSSYTYDNCSQAPVYRDSYVHQSQPPLHSDPPRHQTQTSSYYYPSQQQFASSSSYASNELPPIRTITSGLVAPPSPPPETYSHYAQQVIAPQPIRRSSQVYVDVDETANTSSIPPIPPIPSGLVAMHQVDHRSYYPPSPPRQIVHPTHVSQPQYSHYQHASNTDYYPATSYSCSSQVSEDHNKSFYQLGGRDMLSYSTATYR
ncbi:hypothetical protein JCM5353_005194 [Sporobolomyces roseus]